MNRIGRGDEKFVWRGETKEWEDLMKMAGEGQRYIRAEEYIYSGTAGGAEGMMGLCCMQKELE